MPHKDACLLSDEQARQTLGFCFTECYFTIGIFRISLFDDYELPSRPNKTKTEQTSTISFLIIPNSVHLKMGSERCVILYQFTLSITSSPRSSIGLWFGNLTPPLILPNLPFSPKSYFLVLPRFAFILGRTSLIFQNSFDFSTFFRNFAAIYA